MRAQQLQARHMALLGARPPSLWPLSGAGPRQPARAPPRGGHPRSPQRRHLITHSKWWDDGENANALDELVAPGSDWPEGGETLPPPTLLRRLREAAELRRLGPDVRFSHLDGIEDPPTDGDASLRVLRSSHEIERVGTALRNCAGSYIRRVKRGDYALVALYKGDKVEALAGYARGGRSWDHKPVASCKRNTSVQVQARFDTFLQTLRDKFNRKKPLSAKNGQTGPDRVHIN